MFKVGDKVFSCQFGWGEIKGIHETSGYPLDVSFGKGLVHSYTKCGRYFDEDLHPTLSFTEYDLVNGGFSQERPRDTVTEEHIGKLVKILDEGVWEGFIGVLEEYISVDRVSVNNQIFENVELYEKD